MKNNKHKYLILLLLIFIIQINNIAWADTNVKDFGVKGDGTVIKQQLFSLVCTEMCIGHNTYMQVMPKALHHNIRMKYTLYDGTKVEKT